ncbi:MAG: DUF3343 domain-containing protein [Ruminococcaceae bacterium]|nr:DUF3343 domain-containing protein [Oscillospiraceae bacterium]
MREKHLRVILTFHTTTDAMAMEACCTEKGISGRLIPVPTVITAGCGLCWSAPPEEQEAALFAAKTAGIPVAGVYQMMI